MRYLFLAYLIINPLFYLMDLEIRQAQEWCFQFSSVVLVLCSLIFRSSAVKKDALNISLAVLGLWFCLSYVVYFTGWSVLVNIFLGLAVYLTGIKTLKKEDYALLLKGVCGVFIFSLIYQTLQAYGFDLRGQQVTSGLNGINWAAMPDCSFFGLKASMGIYYSAIVALFLPFAWFMKTDYSAKGLLIKAIVAVGMLAYSGLLFIPVATSYSTGAYMGTVSAMLVIFWFRKRILFWLSLFPIVLGCLFFIIKMDAPMGMMTSRIPMWGMVAQDIHKSPIFGYGLDSFRDPGTKMETQKLITRYFKNASNDSSYRAIKDVRVGNFEVIDWTVKGIIPAEDNKRIEERKAQGLNPFDFWDHPHNEFLWIAYEAGLVGLGILVAVIYFIVKRFRRSKRGAVEVATFSALLVFAVSSLTQFPFHLARLAHLVPVILAMFYLSTEYDTPQIL